MLPTSPPLCSTLCCTRKWALFENWKTDYLAVAKEALVRVCYTEYNAFGNTFTQTTSKPAVIMNDQELWDDEILAASGNDATLKTELEAYLY